MIKFASSITNPSSLLMRFHPPLPQPQTCDGCSSAIKRVLGKLEGVTSVETSVAEKLVVVHGSGAREPRVNEALKKWGVAANKTVEALE